MRVARSLRWAGACASLQPSLLLRGSCRRSPPPRCSGRLRRVRGCTRSVTAAPGTRDRGLGSTRVRRSSSRRRRARGCGRRIAIAVDTVRGRLADDRAGAPRQLQRTDLGCGRSARRRARLRRSHSTSSSRSSAGEVTPRRRSGPRIEVARGELSHDRRLHAESVEQGREVGPVRVFVVARLMRLPSSSSFFAECSQPTSSVDRDLVAVGLERECADHVGEVRAELASMKRMFEQGAGRGIARAGARELARDLGLAGTARPRRDPRPGRSRARAHHRSRYRRRGARSRGSRAGPIRRSHR